MTAMAKSAPFVNRESYGRSPLLSGRLSVRRAVPTNDASRRPLPDAGAARWPGLIGPRPARVDPSETSGSQPTERPVSRGPRASARAASGKPSLGAVASHQGISKIACQFERARSKRVRLYRGRHPSHAESHQTRSKCRQSLRRMPDSEWADRFDSIDGIDANDRALTETPPAAGRFSVLRNSTLTT